MSKALKAQDKNGKVFVANTRQPIRTLEEFKKIQGFSEGKFQSFVALLESGVTNVVLARVFNKSPKTIGDWFKYCPELQEIREGMTAELAGTATRLTLAKSPEVVLKAVLPEMYADKPEQSGTISNTYIQTESTTLIQSLAQGALPEALSQDNEDDADESDPLF